jgi:porin
MKLDILKPVNMKIKKIILLGVLFLGITSPMMAKETIDQMWQFWQDLQKQETLTNGFFGLNDELADYGMELELGVTRLYMQNTRGGISTHREVGRNSGSYDLLLFTDLQKLLDMEGARLFVRTEARWSKSEGINGPSVGSAFNVNGDAGPRRTMDVTELWFEQSMFDGSFLLRLGKMDLTGGFECSDLPVAFDTSFYANDETRQFLNGALINNPTISFPIYALGAAAYYNPIERSYIAAGVVDAQNDARETGFRTTFHDEDYFFFIAETGITPVLYSDNGPLPGAYRIGVWNDPQAKANSDSLKKYRDDVGFYLSFDQMLTRENPALGDNQGLGIFARYGYADGKRNDITNFWSVGFQYQGLIEGRERDTLGVGFAQGIFSDEASMTYTEDHENALEVYYDILLAPWMNLTTGMQYIANPGGIKGISDAVVFEMRTQMFF